MKRGSQHRKSLHKVTVMTHKALERAQLCYLLRHLPISHHLDFTLVTRYDEAKMIFLFLQVGTLLQLCFETLLLQPLQYYPQVLHLLIYCGGEDYYIIKV